MNFQYIKPVENAEKIIDTGFANAKIQGELIWKESKDKNKIIRTKDAEIKRINIASIAICKKLNNIYSNFPIIKDLPLVYIDLLKNSIDIEQFKISLSKLKKSSDKIKELERLYIKEIKKLDNTREITKQRNSFYARTASIINKLSKDLNNLAKSRVVLKNLPDIKPDLYTIVICGYPNVGKSSLLKKLTNCNAEIANYPFTTKNINVGYLTIDEDIIQLMDVPGTFDRTYEEMNNIERNALIIIQKCGNLLFFMFDASEYCGYTIQEQINLFDKIKATVNIKIIPIINKIDLCKKEQIELITKSIKNEIILKLSLIQNQNINQLIELIKKEKK
jgi:nucleolar GTP-binding protein